MISCISFSRLGDPLVFSKEHSLKIYNWFPINVMYSLGKQT